MSDLVLGGFGGPGGWDEALGALGLRSVSIEMDVAACATRAAAGHLTIRADMSTFPAARLAGKTWGQAHSPPCIVFSQAGGRAGIVILAILGAGIRDQFAGLATRARRRREMAHALRVSAWLGDTPTRTAKGPWDDHQKDAWRRRLLARKGSYRALTRAINTAPPGPHLTKAQRMARIWNAVRSASLVLEPARFIHAGQPDWVALEQVPAVLPLWRVYAEELRKLGYSAWAGTLNAADYGVPQTRERAILIASRSRTVSRPIPTHYDPRKGDQLWGEPWVSMATALGWGATGRTAPTVTAGGTATGGAEPFGHRDRDTLTAERDAGQWALRKDAQRNAALRPAPAPAPAPTISFGHASNAMRWVLRSSFGTPSADSGTHEMDPAGRPAHAVTSKARSWTISPSSRAETTETNGEADGSVWKFRNNNNNNACTRSPDEPAGTLFFGGRSNWAAWVRERPATTVPGHKDRDQGESQFAVDSVRITVKEAAVLQSFRPDYPWQGSKTAQFTQVGNAIPPLLAYHVLAMATGISTSAAGEGAA